ncbi:hypothetical protein MFC_01369 [Mesomycoplasma flocculare ATCC 27716]|nr:hypothetical protein MFC_01369 [Mesomycoplasma flocculare ATCC 27716]
MKSIIVEMNFLINTAEIICFLLHAMAKNYIRMLILEMKLAFKKKSFSFLGVNPQEFQLTFWEKIKKNALEFRWWQMLDH